MSAESFDHVRCPICFFILIEPVSLPCLHKLCLACFDKQVEEVNYTCPICRHRISNWARIVSRENNLVDEALWADIQRRFPSIVRDHLQNKIALGLITSKCMCATKPCRCDQTAHKYVIDTPEKPAVHHNLAEPGEIAREYQEGLQKAREEFTLKRMEEAKANEEYILANVSESKRKKLKTLLELQQQKHSESNSKPQSTAEPTPLRSRSATGVSGSSSTLEDRNVCGPLYRSPSTSSIDSITPEIQGFLFKPIHCSPRTPPKRFGNAIGDRQPPPLPALVSYPPVIRSVPRVLDGGDTSSESSFASSCSSLSNFRGGPPQKFRRRYPTRAATRRPDASSVFGGGSQSEMTSSLSPGSMNQLQQRQRYLTAVSGSSSSTSQDKNSTGVESMECSSGGGGEVTIGANDFATLTSRLSSSTISTLNTAAAQESSCQSPITTSRLGRSSRNSSTAQLSGSGNKRKQHAPDEKENKQGATGGVCELVADDIETNVEIPDFKKLRLNSAAAALLQRSLESTDMSPDQLYPGATALALSTTSSTNKFDSSLFINHRKSGVEFLTWEAYRQFLEDKDSQVKLDYKLAKEIETQDRDCRSGSNSPVEERTYSLRKRKVVHKS